MNSYKHPLRVGVGGPVGSGKTALLEALCKAMRDTWQLAVVTNDIYTKEISASSPKRARWRLNASSVWKPAAARIRRSAKMPQ